MIAATNCLVRACCFVSLLVAMPSTQVLAQDTLRLETPNELRELLGQAESLLAAGDSQDAWNLLRASESIHSGHAYFDYLLGVAALDSGRTAEAILSLQRAAAAAPQFSGARMELARAHFDAGEEERARPLFVALLAESPPAGVRSVIDQYIAAIDARPAAPPSDFRPYAELMVGYDDNANGSTSD